MQPHGLYNPWTSPGQNTAVGSCSLLKGIFPAQGSNPGLLQEDSLPAEPPYVDTNKEKIDTENRWAIARGGVGKMSGGSKGIKFYSQNT